MSDLIGTLRRHDDDATLTMERHYPTDASDLWEAITTPERLARWLGEVSGDLHEGGEYVIHFDPDDQGERSWGRVLECTPHRHLRLSWQSPGEDRPSQVIVTITPDADGALLRLEHSGLGHAIDTGYAAGWQVHLEQLAATLDGADSPDFWESWTRLQAAYAATLE